MKSRVLVLAVGNPSRGDDALGPLLAERLEAAALADVEVIVDFQLQIEHALDIEGRAVVIFVDAGTGTKAPFEWRGVEAVADFTHTSHALSPGAVLATYVSCVGSTPPPAFLLCVRGNAFDLGAALSSAAEQHLEAAWLRLRWECVAAAERARLAA